MRSAKATAVAIVGWLSAITGAISADEHSFALEVLWSTPIAAIAISRPAGPGPEPGPGEGLRKRRLETDFEYGLPANRRSSRCRRGCRDRVACTNRRRWQPIVGTSPRHCQAQCGCIATRKPSCRCWFRGDRLKLRRRLSRAYSCLDRRWIGRNLGANARKECHQHGPRQLFWTCLGRCNERCDLHYLKLDGVPSRSTDRGLQTGSEWKASLDHVAARQQCEVATDGRRQPGRRRLGCFRR
jgi:hypothetical protein